MKIPPVSFWPILLLFAYSSCLASITITNKSTANFYPDLKFITPSGNKYHCDHGIPLLTSGESATIPTNCFQWGDEIAALLVVIGVQPYEPDQKAYCPDFDPPLNHTQDIEVIYRGIDNEKSSPINGICEIIRR